MGSLSSPVADVIVGGISGLASLFGADSQSRNVKATNEMNYRIAKEQNDLQAQLARENNDLQVQMMRENNAFNKQSAIDMFNLENEYNLPANQIARLKAAGLNPATFYGSGATMGQSDASTPSASSSGISPSMPSFSLPTMQTPPAVLNTMFGNIESLTRSFGNIAKSGLDLMTKKSLAAKLGPEIDKIIAETEDIKTQQAWNDFKMSLDKVNLKRKQEKEIERLSADIFKAYAEGGAAHATIAVNEALAELHKIETKSKSEQLPFVIANLKKLGVVYEEQAKTEKSKQAFNYAGAENQRQQAEHNKAMARLTNEQASILEDTHDPEVKLKTILAGKEALDFKFLDAIAQYRVDLVVNNADISKAKIEELNQAIEKAKKENNLYYWRFFFERLDKTAQDAGYLIPLSGAGNISPTSMPNNPYWYSTPTQ